MSRWFGVLAVTLIWCLGCCTCLHCVMLALYVKFRRESAVGWVSRGCVADCRALPPVLLCRKARWACLHSSTMQLTALCLLIVNFLFVPVLESPLLGIPVLKVRMLGVPVLVSVLVYVFWRLTVCVSAVSGKRVPSKGSTESVVMCWESGRCPPPFMLLFSTFHVAVGWRVML